MRFFLAGWVIVILALLVWAPSPERSEVIAAIPSVESPLPPVSTRSHSQVWAFEIPDKTRGVATLLERPDGSTLAIGTNCKGLSRVEFEFCPLTAHLLALDKGGKVLWDKSYGNGVERPNHAAVMADGGFLVVGRTWPYNRFSPFHTGVAQQGWAARFSADGELLWERRYSRHGQMAELVWVIALASDLALVSVNHGVPSREHSLLRISLRNGDIVEKVVVPGEVGRLERDSHGVWTTLISSLDRDKPGTTFTIDPTTGSLVHPIQEGPATWEDARGGATIMDSVPLMSGGRLLTTILLGKPAKVSLVTTDMSGRAAWRLTLDDPTVSSVLAMTATADGGFIYVAERWEGRYPEGSPLSPRIVRMD